MLIGEEGRGSRKPGGEGRFNSNGRINQELFDRCHASCDPRGKEAPTQGTFMRSQELKRNSCWHQSRKLPQRSYLCKVQILTNPPFYLQLVRMTESPPLFKFKVKSPTNGKVPSLLIFPWKSTRL